MTVEPHFSAVRYRLNPRQGYLLAIAAPVAAALAKSMLNLATRGEVGFLPGLAMVLLVAGLGGIRPALLATAIGAGLEATLFLPPSGPAVGASAQQWGLFLYVAVSLVTAGLVESLHRSRWRVEAARDRARAARRSEHAARADLEAIVAAIGDGIVVCEADGSVRLMNEAATHLLGRRVATFGELLARLAAPDEGAMPPELADGSAPVTADLVLVDRPMRLALSSFPLAADAQPSGRVVVLRDVTAARQRELLREAFLSVLSHELRTPVTAIYGGASVLGRAEGHLDPDTRRGILDDVVTEADRLSRLVEDLLVLARLDEGVEVGREPALLQHLVEAVVEQNRPGLRGAKIEVQADSGLPPVIGDETSIQQVIHNLVSNAAKYSDPGSVVEVRVEAGAEDVVVRVLDRGRGLSEAEAARVFQPFYRGTAAERMAAGIGIGLYVSRRLVEAMGGRIWARPRPGGGSEFGFALPHWPMEADEAEPESVAAGRS